MKRWPRILFMLASTLGLGCQLDLAGQRSSRLDETVEEVSHIVTDRYVFRGQSDQRRASAAFAGKVTAEEVGTVLNWWTGAGGGLGVAAGVAGAMKWRKGLKALKAITP